jgi:putative tricarboxylic transport membrane protein|tara:strand:+ start:966 stop:1430 length:465 start_codon:yes stop_codon:yes gene_type:complete
MFSKSKTGAVLFLLTFGGYAWLAADIPLDFWSQQEVFNARTMPLLVAAAGIIISLLLLITPIAESGWEEISDYHWRDTVALVGLMVLYGLALEYLGFLLATTAFLIGAYLVLGERRPSVLLLASVPLVVGFWFLVSWLGIYLDPGELYHLMMAN